MSVIGRTGGSEAPANSPRHAYLTTAGCGQKGIPGSSWPNRGFVHTHGNRSRDGEHRQNGSKPRKTSVRDRNRGSGARGGDGSHRPETDDGRKTPGRTEVARVAKSTTSGRRPPAQEADETGTQQSVTSRPGTGTGGPEPAGGRKSPHLMEKQKKLTSYRHRSRRTTSGRGSQQTGPRCRSRRKRVEGLFSFRSEGEDPEARRLGSGSAMPVNRQQQPNRPPNNPPAREKEQNLASGK